MADRCLVFAQKPCALICSGLQSLRRNRLTMVHVAGRNSRLDCPGSSDLGKTMSLFGAISPKATVTPHFSIDGRFVNTNNRSNICLAKSGFHKGKNLVSLFSGELRVVAHQCAPYFGRLERHEPTAKQTEQAFSTQWEKFDHGQMLVASDPWFKENCIRFLCEQEIQIKSEWLKGKNVLDAECGNGRWAYPLTKLGANYTAVDVNCVVAEKAKDLIKDINIKKEFVVAPFADILEKLSTTSDEERYNFLLKKAWSNKARVHSYHDFYAPLINRRIDFNYVKQFLEERGFAKLVRTQQYAEVFVRAIKGNSEKYKEWILPSNEDPLWIGHYC